MRRAIAPVLLVLLLAGCSSSPRVNPASTRTASPITFAVVGDSVTALNSTRFAAGQISDNSWVHELTSDGALHFVGGVAASNITTTEVLAQAKPLTADVLIIAIGTDDLVAGVPAARTKSNVLAIASKISPTEIVLLAMPALDAKAKAVVELNRTLKATANANSWTWVDPWPASSVDGRYSSGSSADGIHPNATSESLAGRMVHTTVDNLFY